MVGASPCGGLLVEARAVRVPEERGISGSATGTKQVRHQFPIGLDY